MSNKKKQKKNTTTKTLYISGMHCTSCELLIEKKMLTQDNIDAVDVSFARSTITFTGKNIKDINPKYLNKIFIDSGYKFQIQEIKQKYSDEKNRYVLAITIIISLIVFLVAFDTSSIARLTSVNQNSSLIAFIILGLVASISSCAALVGGLLLSLTKKWNDTYIGESSVVKFKPHMQFHIGRISAYLLGGAILGLLGDILSFDNITFFAAIIILVSIIMLIISMQMIGVPWAQKFRFALPKSILIAIASHKTKAPFVIGASTFFLPCGFTLIAQGVALTTGSLIGGMLIMGAFAFGTLPILLMISLGGVSLNSKPHLTAKFNIAAGAIIFVFALYNINGQLNVLGLPSLSDVRIYNHDEQIIEKESEEPTVGEEQIITFIADEFKYTPTSSTTLKAGVPTKMIVDNQGVLGCGTSMMARGLFPGIVLLKSGKNVINFVPKKGTYKLTCSMGMVSPVIIKVK